MPAHRGRDFKWWLLERLDERGWSQADLARRSGLSPAQVSRLASGVRQPGLDACLRLAQALGLSLDHVCGVAGLLPLPPEATLETDELLRLAGALPPRARRDLLALLRLYLALQERQP